MSVLYLKLFFKKKPNDPNKSNLLLYYNLYKIDIIHLFCIIIIVIS